MHSVFAALAERPFERAKILLRQPHFGTIIISKQNAEIQKRRKFLYILSEKCKIKRQNDTIQYKGAVS